MNRNLTVTGALSNLVAIGRKCKRRASPSPAERSSLLRLLRWDWILFWVLSPVAVPQTWGQQQATVSGVVRDPSGAVVPDATIRVTNLDTQVTTTAVTNSTGYYVVGNLVPGTYTIAAQKEGFKTSTVSTLTLQVAQSATVDFQLELGQTSQEVSVRGAPPLVERSDATVGQAIGPTAMVELPLNGRNYFNLAELTPGVSSYGLRSFYSTAINDYGTSFNSGSAGEDRNGFTLDGADIKTYLINGSYVPSIDAIQEFKIETTPYAADLGTSPGAQLLLVTKSGTNQFHGDAYEFLRNSSLDAYNYYDNRSLPVPELRKNQFGGTIGGPIIKDKLFFFGSYEGQRERIGETFFGTVPTLLMRQGIFTEVPQPIYNPFTTRGCASCPSRVSRQAFASNTIPSGLISSVSSAFMQSQFPLPTGPGIANNFAANKADRNTRNQTNVRIDDSRPKDVLFGRFSFNNSALYAARQTFGGAQLPGFGDNDVITTTNVTVADAHTFNPATVLQVQVSFMRMWYDLLPEQLGNDLNSKLGVVGVIPNEPFIAGVAGESNPGSDPFDPEFRANNQYSYVAKADEGLGQAYLQGGRRIRSLAGDDQCGPELPSRRIQLRRIFHKRP